MLGVVLATLNMAPTPSTPRTAAMAALRTKPVPRETIVPIAIVRVDRPRPSVGWACAAGRGAASLDEPVMSNRPAAPQGPPGDADAGGQQQDAGTDAGHGQRDAAVLGAAHHHRLLRPERALAAVDQLRLDLELAGRRARHPQVDLRRAARRDQ